MNSLIAQRLLPNRSIKLQWMCLLAVSVVLGSVLFGWAIELFRGNSGLNPSAGSAMGYRAQVETEMDEIPNDEFTDSIKPLLRKYCQDCHWGKDAESDLNLSIFESVESVRQDHVTWERIVKAIETDLMPPEDSPRPTDAEVRQIKSWLLKTISEDPQAKVSTATIRRFNRIEYENTVNDLLRLRNDVFDNPNKIVITDDYFQPATRRMPDYVLAMSYNSYGQRKPRELPGISVLPTDPPAMHGYNNDQSTLSFSPVYMEASIELAQSIVDDVNFPRQSQLWDSLFVLDDSFDKEAQSELARKRLTLFLARAFRRPVTEAEVDRFAKLFRRELEKSNFTQAMRTTVAAVLASPSFLFRQDRVSDIEKDENSRAYAMASRLSYFLWGSMPDDELFQAAAEGRLTTDQDLAIQVRRMLLDRKIKNLSTDFGRQWLKLDKVNSVRPDKDLFPDWYHRKVANTPGESMMIEQLLLFETIMVEDRSILEFISADFSYLNSSLMQWYYLNPGQLVGYKPDITAFEDFFRIKWNNPHRGGIATSGAMLVSTSATTRTSPVYRGAWLLDVVFNQPPPPPPPDVPSLDGDGSPKEITNVREKLAVHRADATCAVCHDRIDPLGFAFEKFDPVGRFRKTYPDGTEIDTKGQLNGEVYDGAARFKNVVLRQKDRFVLGFVKHVAQYALGRGLRITDEPELERIAAKVAERGYRFSVVIEEVALSQLFRTSTPR